MWNNGSYQQNWPVHASNAQQQNVDWGALAQAWIQNRATTEDTTQPAKIIPMPAKSAPANNPVQPNMQAPNFPPASWQNQGWNNAYGNNWMNNHGAPGENYMPHQDSSWYAPPNVDGQFTPAAPPAVVEERPPLPPLPSASNPEPPRPPPSSDHPPEKDFHEPNNVPPNDSMSQQTPDYVQSSWNEPWQPHAEHNSEQWNPPHQANFDAPQWNRGSAPPPWMQGMNNNNQFVSGQAVCMPQDSMNAAPSMASRKLLPAWIREGLEKMEQEKQKKMNNQQNVQEEQDKSKWMEQQSGNRKSRFDSASEGESDAELPQALESPVIDEDNEEEEEEETKPSISAAETQEEMMMKVRRMLTQVLLEVTDAEIKDIAAQVYKKASKAPAKPLMQSSALSSIGQLGVVSGYSSDEEENSNDEQAEDDTSSVDEDFLQRKIEVFEKMQVARIAELENGRIVQEEPEPDVTQQADEAREKEVEANVNDPDVSDRDAPLNAKQLAVVRDKDPGASAPTPDSSPGESSASQNGERNDADVERSREKHHAVRNDEVSRKESKRESPKSKKSSKSKHERDRRRSREREKESRHKKHSRSRHDDSDYDDRKSSHSKHRSSSKKLSSSATKRSRSDSSKRKRSSPHRSSKKLSYSHDKHHSSKSKKRRRKHSDSHSRGSSSSSYTSDNDSVANYSSESDRSYRSHKRKNKKSKSAR